MRKTPDHRPRRGTPELRAVPDSVPVEEEVVRLGVDSGTVDSPKAESPKGAGLKAERRHPPAPVVGVVSLPGQGTPEDCMGDGEQAVAEDLEVVWEGERGGRGVMPVGWVVLLVLGVVGILFMAFWRIPRGDQKLEREVEVMAGKLEEEEEKKRQAEQLTAEIERVARAYLAAEAVEEKIEYVRMPDRVGPLMKRHYATHPLKPEQWVGLYYFEPLSLENYPFVLLKMLTPEGRQIGMLMETTVDGRVMVDWESEAAYQPMSLVEYVERKPAEAMVFRVNVAYDRFYAFEFSDAERWDSLFLSERDSPGFLFGYVEKGGAASAKIKEYLGKGKKARPMLLKLRFLPGSGGTRSVLVEEVVAPGWAYVTDPDEGS